MTKLQEWDVVEVVGKVPWLKAGLYRATLVSNTSYNFRRLRKASIPILPNHHLNRKPIYLEDKRCKEVTLNSSTIDVWVEDPDDPTTRSGHIKVVRRWGEDL